MIRRWRARRALARILAERDTHAWAIMWTWAYRPARPTYIAGTLF